MEPEIEPLLLQAHTHYLGLAGSIQPLQYSSVSAEHIVDVPDVIGLITIEPVVVADPALVAAEFFVLPAFDRLATFHTRFYRSTHTETKVNKLDSICHILTKIIGGWSSVG